MDFLTRVPFFVVLMGFGAVAMIVPAAHGLALGDFHTMRVFFYGFILFSILTFIIGLATIGYAPRSVARSQLLALLAAFAGLPVMFAIPFQEAVGNTSFLNAWFEMVSSFTTTGATVYDNIGRLTPSVHLWRGLVGWLGGLLVWITAVSIFAPMNLGGFEVRSTSSAGKGAVATAFHQISQVADPSERLVRYTLRLAPVYAALTFVLWVGLVSLGEVPYVAIVHAMSVLSTSGITPIGGLYYAVSGFWGEVMILVFFILALSRLSFSPGLLGENDKGLAADPEFRMGLALILLVTSLLFLRHFVGSIGEDAASPFGQMVRAIWGALFTVTSFLTTTGFESRYWLGAADWSGAGNTGLVSCGLVVDRGRRRDNCGRCETVAYLCALPPL